MWKDLEYKFTYKSHFYCFGILAFFFWFFFLRLISWLFRVQRNAKCTCEWRQCTISTIGSRGSSSPAATNGQDHALAPFMSAFNTPLGVICNYTSSFCYTFKARCSTLLLLHYLVTLISKLVKNSKFAQPTCSSCWGLKCNKRTHKHLTAISIKLRTNNTKKAKKRKNINT